MQLQGTKTRDKKIVLKTFYHLTIMDVVLKADNNDTLIVQSME
jgi:hypothetical protein